MVGHDAATSVMKPGGSQVPRRPDRSPPWCLVAQIEARPSCALRAASAAKLKIVQNIKTTHAFNFCCFSLSTSPSISLSIRPSISPSISLSIGASVTLKLKVQKRAFMMLRLGLTLYVRLRVWAVEVV